MLLTRQILNKILFSLTQNFDPQNKQPKVVQYQAMETLKSVVGQDNLDKNFRLLLLNAIIPHIQTTEYESFFEVVYGCLT